MKRLHHTKYEQNQTIFDKVHGGDKQFKCDICDANFTQNNNLMRHRATQAA